jgi:signal transduction histidine kinase
LLHDYRRPLQELPDPLLLVTTSGETLEANRAFYDLARECDCPARLQDLFGPSILRLLAEIRQGGNTRATLPLVRNHPAPHFRVSIAADARSSTLIALLVNVSDEVTWRQRVSDRNRDLSVLNDIGAELSSTIEMDELAGRIHEQTGRIMRADNFYIALYDREDERVFFPLYMEQGVPKELAPRPFSNGMTEYLLRTRQPLLLNGDLMAQTASLGIEPLGRRSLSWIGVPLMADGEAIGVIGLQDFDTPNVYEAHDLEMLTIIAAQAAAAVRNAQHLETAKKAYRELSETQGKLLEAERLRGVTETVGAMNHEVNNPLAAIVGNVQLLLREPGMADSTSAKLGTILEAARRIERVTTKMASIIQAMSSPYPGSTEILDVHNSPKREPEAA